MASNRYGPVGRFGRTYEPLASVTTVRVAPVSVCVAVTVTPGSTAPLSSVTRPFIWAVASCAQAPRTGGEQQQCDERETT